MHQLWSKTLCLMTVLALSVSYASAVEPLLPNPKDAAKAKLADTKSAAKAEADKATAAKDAAKTTASDTKAAAKAKASDTKAAAKTKAAGLTQVDINTASEAELKAIPGIGEAYAAKIVAGRPYAKKDQLKSRNILPGPAYDQVKDHLVAKQPAAKKK